jgi:formylglycine-generating enzyme required for sulfatase activity
MGAQSADPGAPNHVPPGPYVAETAESEGPVHAVELAPYFLSKYELTIAQWERLAGTWPNEYFPGFEATESPMITPTNPVEHVSWEECARRLPFWGLCLPTEAQWERATRAGTDTTYWRGDDFAALAGAVNFADVSLERQGFARVQAVPVDDGHSLHAAVDAFGPNPWGLHGVSGNVWEWCRDTYEVPYPTDDVRAGDGEHFALPATGEAVNRDVSSRTLRGGSFKSSPGDVRVSRRFKRLPSARDDDLGVRPSRPLDHVPADQESPGSESRER